MKSLFSLFILFSNLSYGGRVLISYTKNGHALSVYAQKRINEHYLIPKRLISTKKVKNCSGGNSNYLEFCIDKKDIQLMTNKNTELIKSSLSIFFKKGISK